MDLFAPLFIRQPATAHGHEVLHAVGQELLRHSRLPDGGYADDGDVHVVFDSLDELPPPALGIGNRFYAGNASFVQAHGYINKVNAHGLQSHGDLHAVLDVDVVLSNTSLIQEFLYTEADTDGEIGAAGFADAGNDLRDHPQAVLKAAAVLILPLIGIGRQKLLEQIAVGGVKLHTITARLLYPSRASHKLGNELLDLFGRQGAGVLLKVFAGNGRGGDNRLPAGERSDRFPAWVMELDEDFSPVLMDHRGQPGHTGDMAVLGDGQLPHQSGTMDIIDPGDLRDDQAGSAHGAGLIKGQHIFGGTSVQFRQADTHGGHDQTVLYCDVADLTRGK